MRAHSVRRLSVAAVVMLAAALVLAGCGGSGDATVDPSFNGGSATIEAVGLQFTEAIVDLPAGVPLRLVLDNKDAGVPHNLRVFQGDTDYGKSATVSGPGLAEVRFGPLPAGRYQFQCEIHPAMLGTVVVAP
jgi:plastocyanin